MMPRKSTSRVLELSNAKDQVVVDLLLVMESLLEWVVVL